MTLKRPLVGFAAGFVAVLVFHQAAVLLLHLAGVTPNAPWSFAPTAPLGVPQVLSAAFFGGLWGVVFSLIEPKFPRGAAYWLAAFAFGAIFPSLVVWFVVQPLKGLPIGGGFPLKGVLVALIVNGAWGFGTALIFGLLDRRGRADRTDPIAS